MSALKFMRPEHWARIEQHLANTRGERFAFALTKTLYDGEDGPVLEVIDIVLIDDADTQPNHDGYYLSENALDRVHNQARATGHGLVEFHNHRAAPPAFSSVDERALAEMAPYAVDLLDGTPYAAAVWAPGTIRADWWRPLPGAHVERGQFRTVTVLGEHLKVLNAPPVTDERFTRQIPLLGPEAQAAIGTLRVALVGAGGTGSHAALALAYLGFRNLVVLDDDHVETTNLNRLVTADQADLQAPKTIVARRRMRAIDPRINIRTLPGLTHSGTHPELRDVDLIIGCVDHDGPRHRLNQFSIDTRTPLLDIATGVDESAASVALGGRIALLLPGEACLTCQDELDSAEISRWAKPEQAQALDRAHGYGTGTANPSVVYLNALAVNAALAELGAWISGARTPARWLDIDLVGTMKSPGTRIGPRRTVPRDPGCVDCAHLA
ncbi:ThiF family adenylyltransferase [Streptomyces sp. HPF1205]|uniref:HesA/MoeB/ThiF family protein n=1 Tax=Streptomyces sp. HPF1205 TaxID=2873262 RepID=UPI001CEC51AC|nr:ThiF family adenylyltransferase [Streptomyces sp. HPF1205]